MSKPVPYSKPLTNSFRSNLDKRNPSSTMSSTQDASMEAGQTVSNETRAAVAADNLDMEIENSSPGEKGHEPVELVDYNEEDPDDEDPRPALKKRANTFN